MRTSTCPRPNLSIIEKITYDIYVANRNNTYIYLIVTILRFALILLFLDSNLSKEFASTEKPTII